MPSTEDKQAFDLIFENVVLYTTYLSHANNSIPLDSIIIGTLFHNYKALSELMKKASGNPTENELDGNITFRDVNRLLYEGICKKWRGLIYSLHREDEKLMLGMFTQHVKIMKTCINPEDSKFNLGIFIYTWH